MKEIPGFFIKLLLEQYDEIIVEKIQKGILQPKAVTLRVNTIKSNQEEIKNSLSMAGIDFKEVSWYKDAFILSNVKEEQIQKLEIYEQGKIYLQNLSSMLPPIFLNPKAKENILDMAAAPGGKTTQIAALSQNQSFLTACERNKIRVEKLKYNLQKQGVNSVNVMIEDARNLSDFFSFDKILLDAPCSGSGTENVLKPNFTEELIKKTQKIQEKLLNKALNILKPGGEMIYSTCSILYEENEKILEKVLGNRNITFLPIDLPEEIKTLPTKIKETIAIAPNELFEGFFIAKIKKNF